MFSHDPVLFPKTLCSILGISWGYHENSTIRLSGDFVVKLSTRSICTKHVVKNNHPSLSLGSVTFVPSCMGLPRVTHDLYAGKSAMLGPAELRISKSGPDLPPVGDISYALFFSFSL